MKLLFDQNLSPRLVTKLADHYPDSAHGGDIDLLIEIPKAMPPAELVRRRTRFVSRIYRLLDEQRIDVVIATQGQQDSREVVAAAKREGIKVAQV